MCGLEICGPYDMCDKHNGKGKNQYNCVGKLKDFRKKHLKGQSSISAAITAKLGDKFKGEKKPLKSRSYWIAHEIYQKFLAPKKL